MQSNYYTNKLSVVADIELIKENCYKYNEDKNEFYDLACEMHKKFEELINDIPEDLCSNESNESDPETTIRRGLGDAQETAASSRPMQRSPNRSRRSLSRVSSSLANLPGSSERVLRRSTRSANTNNSTAASNHQHLEGQDDEDESSSQYTRSSRRPRRAMYNAPSEETRPTRQSSRSQPRTRYDEVDSENEDCSISGSEEEFKPTRRSNRTLSSSLNAPQESTKPARSQSRSKYTEVDSDEDEASHYQSEEEFQPTRSSSRKLTRHSFHQAEEARTPRVSERQKAKTSHITHNHHHNSQEDKNNYDSDSDSEESNDCKAPPNSNKRTRIHVRLGKKSCSSPNTNPYPKKDSHAAHSDTRSSSRSRQKVSYAEVGSDVEEYIEESSVEEKEEDSDEDDTRSKKKRARFESFSSTRGKSSPQKKRARASPTRKYIDSTLFICLNHVLKISIIRT